jgi:hypothetical protein
MAYLIKGQEDETGLDMEAAVADIADGLGLESVDAGDDGGDVDGVEPLGDAGTTAVDKPADADVEAPEATDTGAPTSESAPKTWRPEAAKAWETLPPEVKAEVLKREEDMFKGIESYKGEAALGKAVKEVVTPFMPALQAAGIEPISHINKLLHAHQILSTAPLERKQAIFQSLASEYGVTLGEAGDAPYIDPQIANLNKTIDDLRSRLDTTDRIKAEATREELKKEIDTFAANPANVYFDEVANDIAHLLKTKAVGTLAEAYEKAVWMNPTVRAKEVARLAAEKESQAKAESAEKASKAAKATAANVKTTQKQGRGTAPVGSLDDTLTEVLGNIKSRS